VGDYERIDVRAEACSIYEMYENIYIYTILVTKSEKKTPS
jgi:hypothetical protein